MNKIITRQQAIDEQINEIMDEFDFAKVAKYMKQSNWKWAFGESSMHSLTPSEIELRNYAKAIMEKVAKESIVSYGSRGFLVKFSENKDDHWVNIKLMFILEWWPTDATCYHVA